MIDNGYVIDMYYVDIDVRNNLTNNFNRQI
jgi:hypothetical protein